MTPLGGPASRSPGDASAGSSRTFRRAAILGVATPLILLPCGYSFITFGAKPSCLQRYGPLGACDQLVPDAIAATVGQRVIATAVIALVALARARRRHSLGIIYLAVACSIELAVVTCFIAAQWMTGPS